MIRRVLLDLKEVVKSQKVQRHPWEVARRKFIYSKLKKLIPTTSSPLKILDIGCGDQYIDEFILKTYTGAYISAVDTELPDNYISRGSANITVKNNIKAFSCNKYDFIFLFDVLEHIEKDKEFIQELFEDYMSPGTILFITVPAHKLFFGKHDVFLKHHRRYSVKKLSEELERAGYKILDRGNFFFSLFVLRLISTLIAKVSGPPASSGEDVEYSGIGTWDKPAFLTKIISNVLFLDSKILSFLPGLSGYIICQK